jgi:hypothetical protein
MEIHPPTRAIHSVKDYFLHLSMITVGILIALGLEQAVEVWHHHELGVQARENILREVRDNKRELDNARASVKQNMQALQHTLEMVRQLLAHKKMPDAYSMSITTTLANLNSASWTTAAATGALGYMGYDEAKKFAGAYDLQALVQRMQDDEVRKVSGALAPASFSTSGPEALSDDELRSLEREVLSCMAGISMWDQLASDLSKEYDRVLKAQ